MNNPDYPELDLLALIGHTAGGKTTLAAHLALLLGGEVISADSRQVYRGMDIGTGKDLSDYRIGDINIKYHLIDQIDAGEKYSLFDFQQDFRKAYEDIRSRKKLPILCGGTGLYTEAILRGFNLTEVPVNEEFRKSIEDKSDEELADLLKSYGPLHNQSDTTNRDRLIRAIEIARSNIESRPVKQINPRIQAKVFGISYDTEIRRQRITKRLSERLKNGMIEEVRTLLVTIKPEDLMYYGLEYKYLTLYCLGKITYNEMFSLLNTAIHQFAKRQMTWFRGMERRGIPIIWIPGELSLEEKIEVVLKSQ
ncbi:MAG: tRNA (adenosine(37)-N6)-dimethylallyltransferase MiaA [Porphyromonadaceae bacterium]|nr:MAG: tRNA (adenosine(37)-N6)-dimethylallyltransferase MiaA [Porphyromonadaceae bacterium]